MPKSIYFIGYFSNRLGHITNYRLSQHVLSRKRSSSTKDSNGEGPSETKDYRMKLEKNAKLGKSEALSKEDVKETAKRKLFSLLSELKVDSVNTVETRPKLDLAKAVKRPKKTERFKDVLEQQKKTPLDEIESAAKAAAESVQGDPKNTLAELNEKLRILNLAKQPEQQIEMNDENLKTSEEISESLLQQKSNKNIMSTVAEVAAAVTDSQINESSLSQRLLRLSVESKSTGAPKLSLDELVKSMKTDAGTKPTRSFVKSKEPEKKPVPFHRTKEPRFYEKTKFDLFGAPPLDLQISDDTKVDVKETIWKRLEKRQMKLLVQFAPNNAFEEMILWTEQGKHWKLPIDNETEMSDEENVGFHEHVFLEEHLHGFPTKGPVRHFMELVVVGLSMNPYITVERKIENIDWFRDYFKEKQEILQECGALG